MTQKIKDRKPKKLNFAPPIEVKKLQKNEKLTLEEKKRMRMRPLKILKMRPLKRKITLWIFKI